MLIARSVSITTRTSSNGVARLLACYGNRSKSTTSAIRSGLRAESSRGALRARSEVRATSFRRGSESTYGSPKYGSRPSRPSLDRDARPSTGGRSRALRSTGRPAPADSFYEDTYGAERRSAGRPNDPSFRRERNAPRSRSTDRVSPFRQQRDNDHDVQESRSLRSGSSIAPRRPSSDSDWIEPVSRRERRAAFWEQKQAEEAELEAEDDFDKPPSSYDAPRPSRGGRQRDDRRPARPDGRQTRDSAGSDDRNSSRPTQRQARSDDVPAAIKYTTAASQFLYGANVVTAALAAQRRRIYHLYMHKRAEAENIGEIRRAATELDVPITRTGDDELLNRMSEGRPHNGVVLETSPLVAVPVVGLSRHIKNKNKVRITVGPQTAEEEAINGNGNTIDAHSDRTPIVLFLNGITDPGNVGSIIRSAHFFGIDAVAISTQTCASLDSPVMAKASSGACEAIPILRVDKAGEFVKRSSDEGWTVIAAVAPQEEASPEDDFKPTRSASQRKASQKYITASQLMQEDALPNRPRLLMLGSEGEGLPRYLQSRANVLLTIEGGAKSATRSDVGVDSMNVGVAAGVLMHALIAVKPGAKMDEQKPPSTSTQAITAAIAELEDVEAKVALDEGAVEQEEQSKVTELPMSDMEIASSEETRTNEQEPGETVEQESASREAS